MGSGARSGSDGSNSVETGRRVGTSVKWRLVQPPRSKACSAPCDLRYARAEVGASFKPTTQARDTDWDGMEQWLWAGRKTSNRRKPNDSDRDVPSFVVTYPYPAKISRFSCRVTIILASSGGGSLGGPPRLVHGGTPEACPKWPNGAQPPSSSDDATTRSTKKPERHRGLALLREALRSG